MAGAAVYLTEYAANKRLVSVIEYAAETLSGIPPSSTALWGCWRLPVMFRDFSAGGRADAGDYEPAHHHANDPGELENSAAELPRGALAWGRKWRVIRTVVLPGCAGGIITGCIPVGGAHFG